MAVTIKLRGDTAANWIAANPVLADRELGLETDTMQIKIGDGSTAWTSLAYWLAQSKVGFVRGVGTTIQSIPADQWTRIDFEANSGTLNTIFGGYNSFSTDPTYFTVLESGLYRFFAHIHLDNKGGSNLFNRQAMLTLNDMTKSFSKDNPTFPLNTDYGHAFIIDALLDLQANDQIGVAVYSDLQSQIRLNLTTMSLTRLA